MEDDADGDSAKEDSSDYWPLLARVLVGADVSVVHEASGTSHVLRVDVKRRSKWVADGCTVLLWDGDDSEGAESKATDFFEATVLWLDDVPGTLQVSTREPKERLQRCADAFRGHDYASSFFYGKAYEGGALSAYSDSSLLEYMTSLEDNARRRCETFDEMLTCITYEDDASALTRSSPVEQFEAEAGLSSKFLVTFGRLCRERGIFGTKTAQQRSRALRFDQILACHSARWELLKSLRVLEQCQADDYDPAVTNGLGFQTAMFQAEGKKEGMPEMYERLLAFTYRNNLRRSGNTVYQQQQTKMESWKAHASTCSAAGHLLHRCLPGCHGEFVYGLKPGDAWCLAYAEYFCEQLSAAMVSDADRVESLRRRIATHLQTCCAPDDPRWEAGRLWSALWLKFEEVMATHVVAKDASVMEPAEIISAMVARRVAPRAFEAYAASCDDKQAAGAPFSARSFHTAVARYLETLYKYIGGLEDAYRHSEDERTALEAAGKLSKSKKPQFEKMRQVVAMVVEDLLKITAEVRLLGASAARREEEGEEEEKKRDDDDGDDGEEEKGFGAGVGVGVVTGLVLVWGEPDAAADEGTLSSTARVLANLPEWSLIERAIGRGGGVDFLAAAETLTAVFKELTHQMLQHACAWWLRPCDGVTWLDVKGTRVGPAEDMFSWKRAIAVVCTASVSSAAAIRNQVCVTISSTDKTACCRCPVWHEDPTRGTRRVVKFGCRTWTQKLSESKNMEAMDIEELVMFVMDPGRLENTERWRQFVERFTGNLANMAAYMSKTVDDAFQVHLPDQGLFSFSNGMYSIRDNQFYTYDNLPTSWKSGLNYIEQYFDPLLTKMPIHCIRVPGYDDILESQHYNKAEAGGSKRYWLDVFIGRVFFPLGTHDDWQKALIIKGQGATGKSSIAKAIMKCVGEKNVGIIASNCEAQYALANMQNKTMWACTEMKANFRLDMAAMQNMISGDPVTINAKYKDAVDIGAWKLPGLLIGNEIPQAWTCDVGGALLRRTVLFEFGVNPATQDPSVVSTFFANLPAFLVRTTRTYLQATKANKGILVLPSGMQYFQNTFAKITSPFAQFLADPAVADFDYGHEDRFWGIYSQLFKSATPVKAVVKTEAEAGAGIDTGIGIDLGLCYEMKDGMLADECGLTRETLKQVCDWVGKHDKDSEALIQPEAGEPDGHVSVPAVVTRYRAWKAEKKHASHIPDLDRGTIEAMCKQLGILYKNDKLYGLLKKGRA